MFKPLQRDPDQDSAIARRGAAVAYTVGDLLSVLQRRCPVKVDALCKNRSRVEHGLTTVGLKIHCLGDNRELLNLIDDLGGTIPSTTQFDENQLGPVLSRRNSTNVLELGED
jgi:hypothetical protein